MSRDRDISWFRSHIVVYRCGMLDESEEVRFRELLSSLEDCRQFWDEYEPELPLLEDGQHPPAALLARWKTARRDIGAAERVTLIKHIEACDECREDLQASSLGSAFEPDRQADESEVALVHDDEPASTVGDTSIVRVPRRSSTWWLTGWAAAATIACIALSASQLERAQRASRPSTAPSAVVPWIEPRLMRGPGTPSVLQIPPTTRRILLPLLLPPALQVDRGLVVSVEDPGGNLLASAHVLADAVQDGRILLLVESDTPLQANTYHVRSSGRGADGRLEEFESLFTLEHTP